MHELIRLLTEFQADEALIALAQRFIDRENEGVEPLTDDELVTLRDGLIALAEDDEASAALLGHAADVATEVRGEQTEREAEVAREEAERAEQIARLRGDDPEASGEGGEGDAPAETEGGDGEGDEGAGDGTEGDEGAEGETEGAGDREPVTAGGTPAAPARRTSRQALARRTPPARQVQEDPEAFIQFAADVPGIPAGRRTRDLEEVDLALMRRADAFRRLRTGRSKVDAAQQGEGDAELIPVATVFADFPEERRLVDVGGAVLTPALAARRASEVLEDGIRQARQNAGQPNRPLVAAGGLCAPPQPIYDVEVLGDDRSPVRDEAVVSFQAARGAVLSMAPPTLVDLAAVGSVWTMEDDVDALEGSPVKPCVRIECGSPRTTEIEAYPVCLTFGNVIARTYGEWVNAWTQLSMVQSARFNELRRLHQIREASITKSIDLETTVISATRDVLEVLHRNAARIRSNHRLPRTYPFRAILPEVLLDVMQVDIARSIPGGSFAENLGVAEATLRRFFADRQIRVTWSPDLNPMGAQADGEALVDWPTVVEYFLYPEGTFIRLDAGELDLGVVRDATLIGTNDFQTFVESFEAIHPFGVEAVNGTVNVCPSGAVVGTLDPEPICASYT